MASNTKITRAQKDQLKAFKAAMPNNMAFATVDRVTVLVEVDTNVVRFATSVASPDEFKIRPKVGEWCAMDRFQFGQFAMMPRDAVEYDTAADVAEYLAKLLT